MKFRSAFLLVILVSVAAFSCHKKDDKGSGGNLMGKWNGTKMVVHAQQGSLSYDTTVNITPPDYYKLDFKTQNQVTLDISLQGEKEQGAGYYTVQGDHLTLGANATDPDKSGFTYKVSGSSLTLTNIGKDTTINNQNINATTTLYFTRVSVL